MKDLDGRARFSDSTASGNGRGVESALVGEDFDFAHGRGAVAAATTEQCEVAL